MKRSTPRNLSKSKCPPDGLNRDRIEVFNHLVS